MTDYAYIPVRLSHLLGYCAVGSVIRGPQFLVTPMDIRTWTDSFGNCGARPIPYVNQVRSSLGLAQELREPPIARVLENGQTDGLCIPAMRFPSWMRCPKCHRLFCRPWQHLPPDQRRHPDPKSLVRQVCESGPVLEQVPWVFVSPLGHMADTPWHAMAHKDAHTQDGKQCAAEWDYPYLRLRENKKFGGYTLTCDKCKARADFREGAQFPYGRRRCQPWLPDTGTRVAPDFIH